MKKKIVYNIRLTACMSYVLVLRKNPDGTKLTVGVYNSLSKAKASIIDDFRESFNSNEYFYIINCNNSTYNRLTYIGAAVAVRLVSRIVIAWFTLIFHCWLLAAKHHSQSVNHAVDAACDVESFFHGKGIKQAHYSAAKVSYVPAKIAAVETHHIEHQDGQNHPLQSHRTEKQQVQPIVWCLQSNRNYNAQHRRRCANTIIAVMERMMPRTGDAESFRRKLWDHLALMSQFKLDIDYPFDINEARSMLEKPKPIPYPMRRIPVRHYGGLMFEVFDMLKTMPEGKERTELIRLAANQMKRDLVQWGHGSSDNEKVASDLAGYTAGKVQLDLDNFKFDRTQNNRNTPERKQRRRR